MGWREQEGLRPTLLPTPSPARSVADPFVGHLNGISKHLQEFSVPRMIVQPAALILGKKVRQWPLYRKVITSSTSQLTSWTLNGTDVLGESWPYDITFDVSLTNEDGDRFVTLSYEGDQVAHGSRTGDGSITLTADGGSGITGSVTVTYTADGDFTVDVEVSALVAIDEPAGGTFYTDYAIIRSGPVCNGWLSVPDFTVRTGAIGAGDDATVSVQLCEANNTLIEEHELGTLNSEGGSRIGGAEALLIEGSHATKTIGTVRFKVVGGVNLYFDLVGDRYLTDLAAP